MKPAVSGNSDSTTEFLAPKNLKMTYQVSISFWHHDKSHCHQHRLSLQLSPPPSLLLLLPCWPALLPAGVVATSVPTTSATAECKGCGSRQQMNMMMCTKHGISAHLFPVELKRRKLQIEALKGLSCFAIGHQKHCMGLWKSQERDECRQDGDGNQQNCHITEYTQNIQCTKS